MTLYKDSPLKCQNEKMSIGETKEEIFLKNINYCFVNNPDSLTREGIISSQKRAVICKP